MDYSQLHDAQINMMVCKALGHELSSYARIIMQDDATILLSDNKTLVDYCNNPADAWPIIESSNISINNDAVVDEWVASHGGVIYQHCRGKRPLRLAMECFLKIQDTNHA